MEILVCIHWIVMRMHIRNSLKICLMEDESIILNNGLIEKSYVICKINWNLVTFKKLWVKKATRLEYTFLESRYMSSNCAIVRFFINEMATSLSQIVNQSVKKPTSFIMRSNKLDFAQLSSSDMLYSFFCEEKQSGDICG